MATFTERLAFLISAKDDGATRTFSKVGSSADTNLGKVDSRMGKLSGVANNLSTTMSGPVVAGVAAAGTAVAAFTAEGISKFVDLAGKVRDFQRVSGASAEEASKLIDVADFFGVSADKAAGGVFKLSQNLDKNRDALAANGVEVAVNADGNTDLVGTLLNVADAYERTTDPVQRNKLVMDAFGKSGRDLVPILARGREELERMFGEVSDQEIITEEEKKKAEEYRVAMHDLGDAVENFQMALGQGVIPLVTDFATGISTAVDAANEATDKIGGLGGIFSTVAKGISGLREISLVGDSIGDSGDEAEEAAEQTESLNESLEEASEAATGATAAHERLTGQFRDTREEVEDLTEEMHKQLDVTNELIDASLGYEGALNRTEDALDDYWKAGQQTKEQGGDNAAVTEAIERASLDAAEAILGQSRAAVQYAEDLKALNGDTLSAAEAARIQREDLQKVANTLAPTEPLRVRLEGYIAQLGETEGERIAKLTAEVEDAKSKLREVDNIFKSMEEREARLYVTPFVRPVREAPLPEDQQSSRKSANVTINIDAAGFTPQQIFEAANREAGWALAGLGGD